MRGGEWDVVERVFWPEERPECHDDVDDEDDAHSSIEITVVWLKWLQCIENRWKSRE